MELGMVVMPTQGAGDEWDMDLLVISPPYNVTEQEVRQIVNLLAAAIDSVRVDLLK